MAQIKVEVSLTELEKYFTGEDEIGVEFRNHVVQEFAKRHLKAIANEALIQRESTFLQSYVREHIKEYLGTVDYSGKVTIAEPVKLDLARFVRTEITDELSRIVQNTLQQMDLNGIVKDLIQGQVTKSTIDLVRKDIEGKLRNL